MSEKYYVETTYNYNTPIAKLILWFIVLLIGAFIMSFVIYFTLASDYRLKKATVTDIIVESENKKTYNIKYEIKGHTYIAKLSNIDKTYSIGSEITISYEKDNPTSCIIVADDMTHNTILIILIGALTFLIGLIKLITTIIQIKELISQKSYGELLVMPQNTSNTPFDDNYYQTTPNRK